MGSSELMVLGPLAGAGAAAERQPLPDTPPQAERRDTTLTSPRICPPGFYSFGQAYLKPEGSGTGSDPLHSVERKAERREKGLRENRRRPGTMSTPNNCPSRSLFLSHCRDEKTEETLTYPHVHLHMDTSHTHMYTHNRYAHTSCTQVHCFTLKRLND